MAGLALAVTLSGCTSYQEDADVFCPLDGIVAPTPVGWEFIRDPHNDCRWTLVNSETGQHAAHELYEGTGVDPPQSDVGRNHATALLLVAVGASAVVAALVVRAVLRRRAESRPEIPPAD